MIADGSNVTFHYTLTVDGIVVDSSSGKDPLGYQHGSSQIIPGLERELVGLQAGDHRDVVVAPQDGYGAHDEESVQTLPRTSFDNADELSVGDAINGTFEGDQFRAVVAAIEADTITIDLNHPLAGKTLYFGVDIVSVD